MFENDKLDSDLVEFFSDLQKKQDRGAAGNWKISQYRVLDSLAYGVVEPTISSAIKATKSGISASLAVGVQGVKSVLGVCKEFVFGSERCKQHRTDVAVVQRDDRDQLAQIVAGNGDLVDGGIIEDEDLYLYFLCSPAVNMVLEKGGIGFLGRFLLQAYDAYSGLGRKSGDTGHGASVTSWSEKEGIVSNLMRFIKENASPEGGFESLSETAPRIEEDGTLDKRLAESKDMVEGLFTQIIDFLRGQTGIDYDKKRALAKDIANLVRALKDGRVTSGAKAGMVLNFARKHDILKSLVVDRSNENAKLLCSLWKVNNHKTAHIGFDEKIITDMEPLIASILAEGLNEDSFPDDVQDLIDYFISDDDKITAGMRAEKVLNFARKHHIMDSVIKKHSDLIASLVCDIWEKSPKAAKGTGFDKKAIESMKPVIKRLLEEGLNEDSFPGDVRGLIDFFMNSDEEITAGQKAEKIIDFASSRHIIDKVVVGHASENAQLVCDLAVGMYKKKPSQGQIVKGNHSQGQIVQGSASQDMLDKRSSEDSLYTGMIQEMKPVIQSFLAEGFNSPQLAEDTRQLIDDSLMDRSKTAGEKAKEVLDFASEHNIIGQVVVKHSQLIARLACQVWLENARTTKHIGFDEAAVQGMVPVIQLVLEKGLANSFDEVKAFVGTLVDMIFMDYAEAGVPVLVDLTADIFKLAENNFEIRQELSSISSSDLGVPGDKRDVVLGESSRGSVELGEDLSGMGAASEETDVSLSEKSRVLQGASRLRTDASKGLLEYFRGFFVSVFRRKGLIARIKNELEILDDLKKEAAGFSYQKKNWDPAVRVIKPITDAQTKLKEAYNSLMNFENYQYEVDRSALLEKCKKYLASREEIVGGDKYLYSQAYDFATKHQMTSDFLKYLVMGPAELEEEEEEIKKEMDKYDFKKIFEEADDIIASARDSVDQALKGAGADHLCHQIFDDLDSDDRKMILAEMEKQKKEKNINLTTADINCLMGSADIQKKLRQDRVEKLKKGKKLTKTGQLKKRLDKNIGMGMLMGRIKQADFCYARWLISILCGTSRGYVWLYQLKMSIVTWLIKKKINRCSSSDSEQARILKSIEMIINYNPEFWRFLIREAGPDIRDLVNCCLSDASGGYVFTQEERIENSLRNIFAYVITDAIPNTASYEPVNLLLSIWTAPEEFNERYEKLKSEYEQKQQQAGNRICNIFQRSHSNKDLGMNPPAMQ